MRRGTTLADDNARELEPARRYVQHLPQTLRELLHHAFRLDVGVLPLTRRDPGIDVSRRTRGEARAVNERKSAENRGYFLATMCISSVYRAPHEMMLSQAIPGR